MTKLCGEDGHDLYLVASSFEPRSVKATAGLRPQQFSKAVIFNYRDTLDTVAGRHHAREIRRHMEEKEVGSTHILECYFGDPYSAVRSFHTLIEAERFSGIRSVTVDITCFTKVHMLLLLQFLEETLRIEKITVWYTEPLSYATDFGRALSYGIDQAVYLPYVPAMHRSKGVGLIAFLGHERSRLERIVHELEPDVSVLILGQPGFSKNMQDYSRRVNQSLIHRTRYDEQYRMASSPANNATESANVLMQEIARVVEHGCDSIYVAPLGTKLQALGIHSVRQKLRSVRLLLAYTIPKRYERNLYSQGSGKTHSVVLPSTTG